MKKVTLFAFVGLLAVAGLSLPGCGGGEDNKVIELDGTSPPPALNQVQMDQYSKQQASQGKGNPGN
jgi:hypothetical protein